MMTGRQRWWSTERRTRLPGSPSSLNGGPRTALCNPPACMKPNAMNAAMYLHVQRLPAGSGPWAKSPEGQEPCIQASAHSSPALHPACPTAALSFCNLPLTPHARCCTAALPAACKTAQLHLCAASPLLHNRYTMMSGLEITGTAPGAGESRCASAGHPLPVRMPTHATAPPCVCGTHWHATPHQHGLHVPPHNETRCDRGGFLVNNLAPLQVQRKAQHWGAAVSLRQVRHQLQWPLAGAPEGTARAAAARIRCRHARRQAAAKSATMMSRLADSSHRSRCCASGTQGHTTMAC